VCFDTNDGVFLGVKIRRAAESLHGDTVFLDFVATPFEVALADIAEKGSKAGGFIEQTRLQNGVQFGTFLLKSRSGIHDNRARPAGKYNRI
jgi:hypothetical protein